MALPVAEQCPICAKDLVVLKMAVDGHDLVMNSCTNCDTRHWQLAGDEIDLARALDEVGTHAGRRR